MLKFNHFFFLLKIFHHFLTILPQFSHYSLSLIKSGKTARCSFVSAKEATPMNEEGRSERNVRVRDRFADRSRVHARVHAVFVASTERQRLPREPVTLD